MIFTTTISLILALAPATLLAAPTPTLPELANILTRGALPNGALKKLTDGNCDISKLVQPTAPTALPPPAAGLKLSHIAIGRGIQNYTCNPSAPAEAPVAVGAIAKLFNATCSAVRAPAVVAEITRLSLNYAVPTTDLSAQMLSGHHEFTVAGAPYFALKTDKHDFGDVVAGANARSPAPTTASKGTNGLGSVAWLKLDGKLGAYKEVYRLNTAGGVAPKTCEGAATTFSVEYAAEYWFYA